MQTATDAINYHESHHHIISYHITSYQS